MIPQVLTTPGRPLEGLVIRALILIKLVSDCETKVTAVLPAILEIRSGVPARAYECHVGIGDLAMEITDLLAPAQVLINRHALDKSRLFDELARWAAVALGLPSETILSALLKREELGSTGAGNGIALPHARLSGIGKPFILIARLNKAIEFDAIDGVPVDIVCLVLLPEGSEEGQHALACLARVLRDKDVLRNFRRAANHIEAYRALLHADGVIE